MYKGTKMRDEYRELTEAVPRGSGCVSRLWSDSLSYSPRTRIRPLLVHTEAPHRRGPCLYMCLTHISYGEAKSGWWRGGEGSSIYLAVYKQSCIK